MFKRYAEVLDQSCANIVNLFPKAPTPAEWLDSAIEANKLWAKVVQDELATITKNIYKIK